MIKKQVLYFNFLATKYTHAQTISEILYASSSLLALLNDTILRKAANIKLSVVSSVNYLKLLSKVLF